MSSPAQDSELPASCDVLVVGAGPAGAATAVALRRAAPERSVVLIDAGIRPRPLHDEALSQEARPALERLGCWKSFVDLAAPPTRGTLAAWGGPELRPHRFLVCPPRQGWRIEKPALTELLVRSATEHGATVANGARLVDFFPPDGDLRCFEVDFRGRRSKLSARFVVDATGRPAFVARRLGARKVRFDRLVGVFVVFSASWNSPIEADALVEACELGLFYCAPRSPDRVIVAFMTDADLARELGVGEGTAWHELFRESASFRLLAPDPEALWAWGAPTVRAMDSHRLDRAVGEGWLAVGDAAATADSLISQGLHRALATGEGAAAAILDDLAGRRTGLHRYQRSMEQRFEDLLLTWKTIYVREGRWPKSAFWSRRHDRLTLDPDRLLTFHESAANRERLVGLGMHLPSEQLELLCSLCVSPRLAHAVVRAFRELGKVSLERPGGRSFGGGFAPSDRRVLLALQYLVEQGLMTAE